MPVTCRRFFPFLILLASVLLAGNTALACPFCGGPQLTLKERSVESDVVVFARYLRTEMPSKTGGDKQDIFKIEQVLRGDSLVVSGAVIQVEPGERLTADQTCLLFADKSMDLIWGDPISATEAACDYLRDAPEVKEPAKTRLRYYVRFLEHCDEAIAVDAFSEFGNAPYEDIAGIAASLPKERLRGWLSDEGNFISRRGVYGMMLGLCGDDSDAERLESIIRKTPAKENIRVGIDGLMGGYLLLTGEVGLSRLDEWKLKDSAQPFTETYAALQAVRFMWTYGNERISKPRLRQSVRILIDRPELADMVIADLARWQDWSIQDHIVELMDDERYSNKMFHRAVARYLLVASTVPAEMQHDPPAHSKAAKIELDRLRNEKPELMRQVERFYRPRSRKRVVAP